VSETTPQVPLLFVLALVAAACSTGSLRAEGGRGAMEGRTTVDDESACTM